ncbi:MAG: glycoside hydrolase family 3 C-terminal domain-containing protein [Bacilli bacterium]|nr:glycoside hydrolase family 3 C-terminal domain-containing protein [Bacilli bacterium]
MFDNKRVPLYRGLAALLLSVTAASALGMGIADSFRTQLDSAFGTKSYEIDTKEVKFTSKYKTAAEMMNAAKALAVREGAEGTAILRNRNNVLPLSKTGTVALFGSAAYNPIKFQNPNNSDAVDLVKAFQDAGLTIEPTMKGIYDKLGAQYEDVQVGWSKVRNYTYGPNSAPGDYDTNGFQIKEGHPGVYESAGEAPADWQDKVKAAKAVGVCVFGRGGGEGTTYYPGIARNTAGETLNINPLALSPEELSVVAAAKATCDKVVVLLNTSCAMEIGELKKAGGDYEVDGIAYIGLPNDYQCTGIVQALTGDVNSTGALADTYATISTSAPAMQNFGGSNYADYETVADFEDSRWPGVDIGNGIGGSFGGANTYAGGMYIVEAEGIYTGYNYYETRYFDSVMGQGNAASAAGVYASTGTWDYNSEVCYTFGHGLSYLANTQTLKSVDVENSVEGNITATVEVKNESDKDGLFLAQLYVNAPYTDYDKTNLVEKSAIQFLGSKKVEVKAGKTAEATITVPTKYLASYDYKSAKTYVLDGGDYHFAIGAGAHEAVNNVLGTAYSKTGLLDEEGAAYTVNDKAVVTKAIGSAGTCDTVTYSKSANGAIITNVVDNADLNYYLPGTVTYLSRQDWQGTYPKNYNKDVAVTLANSSKKAEWLAELRNQQHVIATDDPVENLDGVKLEDSEKFDFAGSYINDINDKYWDKLVSGISADNAIGAIAHGGNQSDILTGAGVEVKDGKSNINNPIVGQADGPQGFSGTSLSSNNGESADVDPYFVDPESTEGQFKACVNSQTLLGSSFSPDLALEWGDVLGNTGLWVGKYEIWGAGLNYHRSQYNGRNTEYPSEDPMLSCQIGAEMIKGASKYGIIVGPKHIGFNDQEYDRSGICVYMHEQKFRQTDLRGFQGAIEDQKALGMMIAFNRIGAVNASHNVGMIKGIFRTEWGFKGLISTDMMNNKYYFNPEGAIMATVTMMADFAANDASISKGEGNVDKDWTYLSVNNIKNDNALVEQARQNLKYQLYAFANSAVANIKTNRVVPSWEAALNGVTIGTGVVGGIAVLAWAACSIVPLIKKEF